MYKELGGWSIGNGKKRHAIEKLPSGFNDGYKEYSIRADWNTSLIPPLLINRQRSATSRKQSLQVTFRPRAKKTA